MAKQTVFIPVPVSELPKDNKEVFAIDINGGFLLTDSETIGILNANRESIEMPEITLFLEERTVNVLTDEELHALIESAKLSVTFDATGARYQITPERQVQAIQKATEDACKSKESATKFLTDAGILPDSPKASLSMLDEKGFVFEDGWGFPLLMRMYNGKPYIFDWCGAGEGWHPKREADATDLVLAARYRLSDEDAEKYHEIANRK